MISSEIISRLDSKIRPLLSTLPPFFISYLYSTARKYFLKKLAEEKPKLDLVIPLRPRKLWDIDFGSNLFNAAGMFKLAEGYQMCYQQGAGAYLAGTVTSFGRKGNKKFGITHPFLSYPKSFTASNWMGLPNPGSEVIAKAISTIEKKKFCPIGVSISKNPDMDTQESLNLLVKDLFLFEKANVDFIEINESCPNVKHNICKNDHCLGNDLIERLEFISINFLKKRNRKLPVIVKLSNDTDISLIPEILDALFVLNYDGINFGNTSTKYEEIKGKIIKSELKFFDYFTTNFGGGVSGLPLKESSLTLCQLAMDYHHKHLPKQEFNVIRTGGIFSKDDLLDSDKCGILLNQWFTGYFHNFSIYGHKLYQSIYKEY